MWRKLESPQQRLPKEPLWEIYKIVVSCVPLPPKMLHKKSKYKNNKQPPYNMSVTHVNQQSIWFSFFPQKLGGAFFSLSNGAENVFLICLYFCLENFQFFLLFLRDDSGFEPDNFTSVVFLFFFLHLLSSFSYFKLFLFLLWESVKCERYFMQKRDTYFSISLTDFL